MRTPGTRDCGGCRYWSEMIAEVQAGEVVAMCLGTGTMKGRYTTALQTCGAYARNSWGAVDEPPNYGEEARAHYEEEAQMKHPNGAPKFAADGTLLTPTGTRSIFDDVDL
jgi:uncharacterized protein YjlB